MIVYFKFVPPNNTNHSKVSKSFQPENMSKRSKKQTNFESKTEDYYIDDNGLLVFTAHYHKKRGYCCQNGCRHCPYGFKK
ncbi:hypothetical protein AWW68_06845 [Roseivirga spongicola]|jgi:hypothetical protein|uniref:Uncharacterized protein n=3 Tax=Roseivirgaceae TaxID=2762306 RepID=A0A150XIB9_9BACT|nr:hypothetical protein AWW68_06845 [Roseivirga spongicola]PWL31217.1 MAG: hypothetical protein DCO95_07005 [Roseivirga sp. XM-24bin3]|tara:strand:+ start:206 stop:445 length:240 start_codon:yes stop_codon:yes gene_type:complete